MPHTARAAKTGIGILHRLECPFGIKVIVLSYMGVKSLHLIMAILSIAGFLLRGYWMMIRSDKLQATFVRVAPHVVDTIFILSGIGLVWLLQLPVLSSPWLLAKFIGLAAYIALGMIALKRGPTLEIRVIAFIGALAMFAYIVGAALLKSPMSWLSLMSG